MRATQGWPACTQLGRGRGSSRSVPARLRTVPQHGLISD
jgi:hypothetical protein